MVNGISFDYSGATVLITGRKESAGDYDADLSGLRYRQLDVADKEALYALADSLSKLDILATSASNGPRAMVPPKPAWCK